MKLWERSLFLRLIRTQVSFLFCLFALYTIVDLALHSVRFFSGIKIHVFDFFLYYFFNFSLRLDLFVSLSFLLSVLSVLIEGAISNEFVALQMAGLSQTRLLRPFISVALLSILCSYTNFEWIVPRASESIDHFRGHYAKRKKSIFREHIHTVSLEDGSEIVYLHFDPHKQRLFDLFWLINNYEVWHVKEVDVRTVPPTAYFVDQFFRDSEGQVSLKNSFKELPLHSFSTHKITDFCRFIPFEYRPLSVLLAQTETHGGDRAMILSHLHHKCSLPFVSLFFSLLLPPFLFRFSRAKTFPLLIAVSLFGLVSFFVIFDGLLIIAENRMLPPGIALWSPWILFLLVKICIRTQTAISHSIPVPPQRHPRGLN